MGRATAKDTNVDQNSTEGLIRSVMTDQKRVQNRKTLPDLEPADGAIPDPVYHDTAAPAAARRKRSSNGMKSRILNYRPTRKHIIIAAFVLVMILRPWLIPGLLFVTFWVGLIAWLTLGPDRVTEWFVSMWDRLSQRNPAMAEKLRQRGDAFALKFDALLEKLPSSWAEKLALPDMSNPVKPDVDLAAEPDPFDKLKLPEVYRG